MIGIHIHLRYREENVDKIRLQRNMLCDLLDVPKPVLKVKLQFIFLIDFKFFEYSFCSISFCHIFICVSDRIQPKAKINQSRR